MMLSMYAWPDLMLSLLADSAWSNCVNVSRPRVATPTPTLGNDAACLGYPRAGSSLRESGFACCFDGADSFFPWRDLKSLRTMIGPEKVGRCCGLIQAFICMIASESRPQRRAAAWASFDGSFRFQASLTSAKALITQ